MNKNIKRFLTIFSFVLVLFAITTEEVSAKKGDPATANVTVYVYTDIKNMSENRATGNFTTLELAIPVKQGDVWERPEILSKVSEYGEQTLKQKTGDTYTIYDVLLPPDSNYIIDNEDNYTRSNNEWYRDDNSRINVTFLSNSRYDSYDFSINVIANKGGKLNGWKAYTDNARYFVGGKYLTGMNKVGQTTYLFNSNGGKEFGWHVINGQQVYFNELNGGLWTGKRKIGQTTYLFNSQGHKLYGWHRLNDKDYYFAPNYGGGMVTGQRKIGETVYLFHNDGYKHYGWNIDNRGKKYYFDPNFGGGRITGLRKVGNATYYFDTYSGEARTNHFRRINGQSWNFNAYGIGKIQ